MTYRGECKIKTYQYMIVEYLYREWIRRPDIESSIYSINAPILDSEECNGKMEIGDTLKAAVNDPKEYIIEKEDLNLFLDAIKRLEEEDRIYLKLISFFDIDLEPEDIRAISKISGRNLLETTECILDLENVLSKRYKEKRDELNKVNYWILTQEKTLKKLEGNKYSTESEKIDEKAEIERKLLKRMKQKDKILNEYRKSSPTVSYREIAKILNISVGTVSTKIKKARSNLNQLLNSN